MYIYK